MRFSLKNVARTGMYGLPALLAPVIIMGGIFLGSFTPTEASAIAFVYCLIIGAFFFRELDARSLYRVIYEGGRTTGIVALELAAGLLFSNLMTIEGIPENLVETITNLTGPHGTVIIVTDLDVVHASGDLRSLSEVCGHDRHIGGQGLGTLALGAASTRHPCPLSLSRLLPGIGACSFQPTRPPEYLANHTEPSSQTTQSVPSSGSTYAATGFLIRSSSLKGQGWRHACRRHVWTPPRHVRDQPWPSHSFPSFLFAAQ